MACILQYLGWESNVGLRITVTHVKIDKCSFLMQLYSPVLLSHSAEWINIQHCRHKYPAASQKSATLFFGAWKKFVGRWGSHERESGNHRDCCVKLLDFKSKIEVQIESKTLKRSLSERFMPVESPQARMVHSVSSESPLQDLFTSGKVNITPPLNPSAKSSTFLL